MARRRVADTGERFFGEWAIPIIRKGGKTNREGGTRTLKGNPSFPVKFHEKSEKNQKKIDFSPFQSIIITIFRFC